MRKYVICPLALLLILLGSTLCWADAASDVRQCLDGLPTHMNVKYDSVSAQGDTAVVSNLRMSGFGLKPISETASPIDVVINTLEITGFNANALKDTVPSLLAERVLAKGVTVVYPEDGYTVTLKQLSMNKPLAPWANLSQLKGKPEDEIWRQLTYVRIDAFVMEDMLLVNDDIHDPVRISTDRLSAQNLSLLYCTDMRLTNFKAGDPSVPSQVFSIASISLNYNFYDYLLPMIMKPGFSMEDIHQLDPTNKYKYEFVLESMKSSFSNLPFTIKRISFAQDNHNNFNGRCGLEELRIENKDLRAFGFFGDGIAKHLLKGKPLMFSLDVKSSINIDKFLPSTIQVRMPGIANIDFNANLALTPEYLKELGLESVRIRDLMFDFDEQLKWVMRNSLAKDMSLTYQDKGLIGGIISYSAASDHVSVAQAKNDIINSLNRNAERSEPGFERDFMKNVKALVQKPGTLALTLTPKQPVALSRLIDMVSDESADVKYNFKLK